MHSCEEPTCTNWVRFGPRCHKHTTDDELVATFARKPREERYTEERLLGIGVVSATEVRVTRRPSVGRVKPWTNVRGGTIPLSDCTVIHADGTRHKFGERPTPIKDKATTIRDLNRLATTADHDNHTND